VTEDPQKKVSDVDMTLLNVDDLRVEYPTRAGAVKAVDGVSFNIKDDETFGLIGESGCGKSTLVSALLRFVSPPGRIMHGKVVFKGRNILALNKEEIRRLRGGEMAIVLQGAQNALNPVLTVGMQIAEQILEHESISRKEAWQRAKQQLELVGISSTRVKSYPHEFSGGMRQRVMIAIATACSPKLLIMDEPVTGLDVIVQRHLLILINELKEKILPAVIFITHDLSVITETCDRVAVMYAGKIVEEASMVDLYQRPFHPYSQALINSYPSIKGERRTLQSIPGAPPDLVNPPAGCRFHPRCPSAMQICRTKVPVNHEYDSRWVTCHLVK